jgi:hypothetical protein
MQFRKPKPNPEDPEHLKNLIPQRRFTLEEVRTFMELARGLINDGLPIISSSQVVELDLWYQVEVMYDDGTPEHAFETWYFFRQYID